MESVVIIGAGGRARLVTEIFEMLEVKVLGYISSEPKGTIVMGNPVLFSIEELLSRTKFPPSINIFISMGDNIFREKLAKNFEEFNFNYINCIHPGAKISKYSKLGKGNFIDLDSIIQNYVELGDFNSVGNQAIIGHDSKVGDYVNFAPCSLVCGSAIIEDLVVIGPNSTVLEKRKVSYAAIVGAGALVNRDVDSEIVVSGLPARYIKKRDLSISYLK